MISVKELLTEKGRHVWSISPEDTVYDAIKIMDERHVGALTVMNGEKLVGIISERDYARQVILKDRTSKETRVEEIMTRDVIHAEPEQHIDECMVMMNEHHVRHLPVLRNQRLIGMISISDVVKEIIKDQKYTIKQLQNNLDWAESY